MSGRGHIQASKIYVSHMLLTVQNIVSFSFRKAPKEICTCLSSKILKGLAVSEIPVPSEGEI